MVAGSVRLGTRRGPSTAEVQDSIDAAIDLIPDRMPKWIAGRYYDPRSYLGGTATTAALTANSIYASPLWVPPGGRIDRIGINVSSAAAAGKIARFMIHQFGANDLPAGLLLDAGTILVDGTGDKELTVDYTPPTGWVWLSILSDGAPTVQMCSTSGLLAIHGLATISGTQMGGPVRATGASTAPDPWGTPGSYLTAGYVRIGVRAA